MGFLSNPPSSNICNCYVARSLLVCCIFISWANSFTFSQSKLVIFIHIRVGMARDVWKATDRSFVFQPKFSHILFGGFYPPFLPFSGLFKVFPFQSRIQDNGCYI